MYARRMIPPPRICPRCGARFHAWRESDCPHCRRDRDREASALAQELRRRRLERRRDYGLPEGGIKE